MPDSPDVSGRELNTAPGGIGLTEPHTEPIASRSRLRWYVAFLLLAPFLYIAICVGLMRGSWLTRHSQSLYYANLAWGLKLRNADCQILIYGDSSAMEGADPATIREVSGLSACNIAEIKGMMVVNGTMIVDDYLAHNPPPRYLVFLFSPDDMAGIDWSLASNYEPIVVRLRQHPDLGFLHISLLHTENVLAAIELTGRFALSWGARKPLPAAAFHNRDNTLGRLVDPSPAPKTCPQPLQFYTPNRAWTDNLRARYSTAQTRVLVDVAPEYDCSYEYSMYSSYFTPGQGISDNTLITFPLTSYNSSGHLHYSLEGAKHLSQLIGAQILALERQSHAALGGSSIGPPEQNPPGSVPARIHR